MFIPQVIKPRRSRGWMPGGIPRIDWSNPLTASLVSAYCPGVDLFDVAGIGPLLQSANLWKPVATSSGLSAGGAGTGTGAALAKGTLTPRLKLTTVLTIFWRGVQLTAGGNGNVVVLAYANAWSSPFGTILRLKAGTTLETDVNNNGTLVVNTAAVTIPSNTPIDAAMTVRMGGTAYGYFNGSQIASFNPGAGPITYAATAQLCLGNNPTGSDPSQSTTLVAYIFSRQLSAGEIASLHNDPYQFLIFPEDIVSALMMKVPTAVGQVTWGYDDPGQFPIRRHSQNVRPEVQEVWPFTSVPTPTQFGWDNPEVFSPRKRYRLFQPDEPTDQWPFTVTRTPTQFGWDNPEKFAERRHFQPLQPDESTDQWPFTSTPTPGQFGWDNPELFARRHKPQPFQPDEPTDQWPHTAVLTPVQSGWDNPEHFAIRAHYRFPQPDEPTDQWPFTNTPTPAQFGFENPSTSAPHRTSSATSALISYEFVFPPFVPPPPVIGETPWSGFTVNMGRMMTRRG